MNKVILVGNLTRDPELQEIGADGTKVCKFSLAVNRQSGTEKVADFYNITAWQKLGENCASFLKKGSKAAISGDIQIRNYEDKEGNKRTSVEVIANAVEFLDRKPDSSYDKREEQTEPVQQDVKITPINDDKLPF